jgi:serine/threonine protein kinase/tetratricopeptide (TPR) repeat protein
MREVHPDLVAALADRYRIDRALGGGGMAVVCLAEDLKHGRQVAIKVFRPELAVALGPARFLREIAIVAQLSHPHILPLYDSGEARGLLYYVMPYVAGGSLRERLDEHGQLAIGEAVQLARQLAGALDYAHARGVVHRDIKPENVLLEEGHAVLTDFGIAMASTGGDEERITTGGLTLGTPAYMSPEQASGDPYVDGRSDQYSLAIVLYEMLAGQPPFRGVNARATIARQIADPVPPLVTVRPELRPGLVYAVERALAKAPVDRFATMSDFADALTRRGTGDSGPPQRSIAVLPFANLTGLPDDAYLSDGLSEEVVRALMKVDGLHVATRTAALSRELAEDHRAVGRALNVRTVLEGSVRRVGTHLRVTARLVNVEDGYHLWAERFDREMKDVLAIQDEIAESIVRSLRVMLSREERQAIRRGRTDDPEAYAFYLRGRQFFFRFQRKALEHACEMFRRAIAIDPNYARAHAGLADSHSFLHMYFGAGEADLEQAESASARALAIAPGLAEAHAAHGLAVSLRGRYEEAAREFQEAIARDPRLFEARYFYARAAFHEGRIDEALRLFEEACHVREDYQARLLWAQCHAALGRTAEAEAAYRHALRVIEDHLELNPGDTRALMLGGSAWARVGERAKALEWGERTLALDPEDAVVLYGVACVFAVAGERERALELLERAVRAGFRKKEWIEHDPDLDAVRAHPRYRAVIRDL